MSAFHSVHDALLYANINFVSEKIFDHQFHIEMIQRRFHVYFGDSANVDVLYTFIGIDDTETVLYSIACKYVLGVHLAL